MQKKLSKNWLIAIICAAAAIVIATVTCLIVFVGFRTDKYTKGLVIEREGKGYAITSIGTAKDTNIIVPKYFNGKKVTKIAQGAFKDSDITSIKLPNSLKVVEKEAFANCDKLEKIVFDGQEKKVIFNGGFACHGVTFGQDAFVGVDFLNINIQDSSDGDSQVEASVTKIPQGVTKVVINAALFEGTDIEFKSTIDIVDGLDVQQDINFGTYGYFNDIEIEVYSGETLNYKDSAEGVKVTAPHYNIAYLNGTYPVLVYSLKLHEIAATDPTFTFLERAKAYDWDKLPYNVQCLPFLTREKATSQFMFHNYREAVSSYIKQLYSLNNQSTFTLYCVDNYAELLLQYFVANQIPETNWNAYLLSDGIGTAVGLCDTFGVANPQAKYNTMKQDWQDIKEYVYNNGYNTKQIYKRVSAKYNSDTYNLLNYYSYLIAKEEDNVEWWVNRLRTGENLSRITEHDADFAQDIVDSATSFYTNGLLANLNEEQKQAFKDLYHFNDEMFDSAREQEKKIMIILGSDDVTEGDDFYSYIRLTMDMYGDEYVYYYKGHPGFPTSLIPNRQRQLAKLEKDGYTLYELDNAVAAEVILYFNPDVYLTGWNTSTFDSVEDQSMLCAIYALDIEEKVNYNYGDMVDVFITLRDGETYNGIIFNNSHKYYILKYNNTAEYENQMTNYNKHEIAIYDSTSDILTYYKLNTSSGVYEATTK